MPTGLELEKFTNNQSSYLINNNAVKSESVFEKSQRGIHYFFDKYTSMPTGLINNYQE